MFLMPTGKRNDKNSLIKNMVVKLYLGVNVILDFTLQRKASWQKSKESLNCLKMKSCNFIFQKVHLPPRFTSSKKISWMPWQCSENWVPVWILSHSKSRYFFHRGRNTKIWKMVCFTFQPYMPAWPILLSEIRRISSLHFLICLLCVLSLFLKEVIADDLP